MIKVFVRHGTSVNNERAARGLAHEDRVGGYQPNVELARIGQQQARALGRILLPAISEMLDHDVRVVRVSAGPSVRTRHTAEHMLSTMDPHMPQVVLNPHLHELRKGNKWLGGDEKRLRSHVETPAFHERRAQEGWDFRYGRPVLNALGLWRLHGGETARESATRLVTHWFDQTPLHAAPKPNEPLALDVAVSHGLAGRYATAMLLHSDPSHPNGISMTVQEADKTYNMPNASAHVFSPNEGDGWTYHGRILVPEHMYA
jgi:broad specificity phosphatase PhoE